MSVKTFGSVVESEINKYVDRLHKDGITEREIIYKKIVERFERRGLFIVLLRQGITKDDFCIYINECLDKKLGVGKEE